MSAIELLESARKAFDVGNTDRSLIFYEQALEADPTDWEAAFFTRMLRMYAPRIGDVRDNLDAMLHAIRSLGNNWRSKPAAQQPDDVRSMTLIRASMLLDVYSSILDMNAVEIRQCFGYERYPDICKALYQSYVQLIRLAEDHAKKTKAHLQVIKASITYLYKYATSMYASKDIDVLQRDVNFLCDQLNDYFPQIGTGNLPRLVDEVRRANRKSFFTSAICITVVALIIAIPLILLIMNS